MFSGNNSNGGDATATRAGPGHQRTANEHTVNSSSAGHTRLVAGGPHAQSIPSEMLVNANGRSLVDSRGHVLNAIPGSRGGPPVRDPELRPVYKLSIKLIDTYKHINKVYYEARSKKNQEVAGAARGGVYNDGYDDQHYDYIIHGEDLFADRYLIRHRIGKGSFGQVVCAYDQVTMKEVAIKIIKSRRPFMLQAQTEITLLKEILEKDIQDEHNIVRMINKFVFRNHQCLVFEMLSYNLYELLKNTRFKGVSLNLIRKFSKQILTSLKFLASPEVDIIHCDLKPENILLRHPRRSAIKLIDFGSSCLSSKRTYTYIQSRFYRSPEILLGLKYDQKIDIWSLGCVLVEMHTGEPLFGGADQMDQMCRIVDVLGMPPFSMIEMSPTANWQNFFERVATGDPIPAGSDCDPDHTAYAPDGSYYYILKRPNRDAPAPRTLEQILGVGTGGPFGRRKDEAGHSHENYIEFLSFIAILLRFDPVERASAADAMKHLYITEGAPVPIGGERAADNVAPAFASAIVGAATGAGNDQTSVLEKRRGRDPVEWKPRSRSVSAPTGKAKVTEALAQSHTTTTAGLNGYSNGDSSGTQTRQQTLNMAATEKNHMQTQGAMDISTSDTPDITSSGGADAHTIAAGKTVDIDLRRATHDTPGTYASSSVAAHGSHAHSHTSGYPRQQVPAAKAVHTHAPAKRGQSNMHMSSEIDEKGYPSDSK